MAIVFPRGCTCVTPTDIYPRNGPQLIGQEQAASGPEGTPLSDAQSTPLDAALVGGRRGDRGGEYGPAHRVREQRHFGGRRHNPRQRAAVGGIRRHVRIAVAIADRHADGHVRNAHLGAASLRRERGGLALRNDP